MASHKYKYEKEQALADAKHQEELALSAEREKRQELIAWSPNRIAKAVLERWEGRRGYLLAPVHVPDAVASSAEKGALWQDALREEWLQEGFVRALRNGEEVRLDAEWPADAPGELMLLVDRVAFNDRGRLVDGAEQCAKAASDHDGRGLVIAQLASGADSGSPWKDRTRCASPAARAGRMPSATACLQARAAGAAANKGGGGGRGSSAASDAAGGADAGLSLIHI